MESVHFGEKDRQRHALPNCIRVSGGPFFQDNSLSVAELAFDPHAELWEHTADHAILFVVIAGSGFCRVGEEERRVTAGDAVAWPQGMSHKAWTHEEEMTALAIEYGPGIGRGDSL